MLQTIFFMLDGIREPRLVQSIARLEQEQKNANDDYEAARFRDSKEPGETVKIHHRKKNIRHKAIVLEIAATLTPADIRKIRDEHDSRRKLIKARSARLTTIQQRQPNKAFAGAQPQ